MDIRDLPRMIDLSCVKTESTFDELNAMVTMAKKYQTICCFAMPCYTQWLANQLNEEKDILVGGTIGFPSGADMTEIKAMTANHLVEIGCGELDMVINVSALKSGHYDMVENDIKQVYDSVQGLPLKVILEVAYLTDYEIQKGSEFAVKNGAAFVKTGTGLAPKPTTVEHIRLIHKTIGGSARIKAAGGVRTLDDIRRMVEAGCTRFGIGLRSAQEIFDEAGL